MASDLVTFIRKRDAQLRAVWKEELEAMLIQAKTYHENAVRNWTKKPKWKLTPSYSANELRVVLETVGDNKQLWQWVDEGTGQYAPGGSPYWIFPRSPGGRLTFQTGYNPKTRPIAKANVGDGSRSGAWVNSAGVLHPGIEGRKFSESYRQKVLYPAFKIRLIKRVRRV